MRCTKESKCAAACVETSDITYQSLPLGDDLASEFLDLGICVFAQLVYGHAYFRALQRKDECELEKFARAELKTEHVRACRISLVTEHFWRDSRTLKICSASACDNKAHGHSVRQQPQRRNPPVLCESTALRTKVA